MKKALAGILAIFLLLMIASACADRIPEEKGWGYYGAMKVVYCKEYVTLREEPRKTASPLAKIPLGDIVYNCQEIQSQRFLQCEYQGQTGYVLKKYLKRAPEFEPPVTSAITKKMTMEEVIGDGETVFDWKDYNISVLASRYYFTEKRKKNEGLRVGCFINGEPMWGHIETCEVFSEHPMLKAFVGGDEDDPQIMLYDGGYGLTMIDLLSGKDKWTLTTAECPLGDAAVVAVSDNGTMYIAGTDGPHPVAITPEGRIYWKTEIDDPEIYDPSEIKLKRDRIEVYYRCGKESGYTVVELDYTGEQIGIREVDE